MNRTVPVLISRMRNKNGRSDLQVVLDLPAEDREESSDAVA
jgi:hypothetical protein